ncbi:tripartite tricarboxylate transporter permease [Xenorhabdus sp. 12]|uniref:Tripartite tricarboxylate transporter permease n=1 Tax=Xenorhabdus santafensis TaxID=2582833 RepID=A0ABU4SCB8_9GAMM|nr:tripartite tricarboxylate transporter permease [Xenorhabdus sp. 12]MDX7988445.1 tripartite tricarboxylate transporter permease [Xenorhabdus sp. 12]
METWLYLSQGFEVALVPKNLVIALIGCFIGTIVGLLPGLGPINGVAILLPLAFALKLPAESALILLATVYIGCEYGGRISSILLNVPGDAAAIMTALDGHPMAKQGRAGVALSISAVSSFCGSLLAITGIILFAPLLAKWSLAFGPAEYFALMVFAIACLGSMMSQNPVKSLLAALIGLSLATVGVDSNTGVYRFTFDSVHLSDGIQFIVVVIGLFSVSEILLMLEKTSSGQKVISQTGRLLFNRKEAAVCVGPTLRSSVIGFFVGILPGAGATIASAITYMTEKRLSGNSDSFGKGDIRGVAAPEAANNASACGSFIPMLTLGVPGSGTTAVMIGALTLYNITPGPAMFTEQPDIVWGLIAALLIANILLLIMNIPMIGVFTRMLNIPTWFLVPSIAIVSAVGVYAVHSTTFDLMLMVGLGVFGYILRKMNFPMSPLILGFVLGEMLEQNLRRALSISNGNFEILWSSTIAQVLLILAILVLTIPPVLRIINKRRHQKS